MSIPAFAEAMPRILAAAGNPGLIISALSGGMDSVVLLRLLHDWRSSNLLDIRIVAAHLNHNLRGDAARGDAEFSRRQAAELDIPYFEESMDVAAFARENGLGLEAAGRAARHRFFRRLMEEEGGGDGLVLTGHHADDQAETILMHLRRGAHRRGLAGMREFALVPVPPGKGMMVGRPLLRVPREAMRRYAVQEGLIWREDATNADPAFVRNRIRHRIIPILEGIMPGFRERLLARAETLAREESELVREGADLAESLSSRESGGRVFRLIPEAMDWPERFNYALRHIVEEEMGCLLPYGAALAALARLAESGRHGETLTLPGRLMVRRESDGLFFFFPGSSPGGASGTVMLPDAPFEVRAHGLVVSADWRPAANGPPPEDKADPEVEWLNPLAIRWPLCIRAPLPGERFRPLGAPGSKKIRDILTDRKIPRRKRDIARVLADYAGAIWLWPCRMGNRVRLGDGMDRALRVEIREVTE